MLRTVLLRRLFSLFAAGLVPLTLAAPAAAGDAAWARHPARPNLAPKPIGVPTDYVRTRHGFFHPSCVVAVRPDEVWGTDLVVRGLDGTEHDRIGACQYPRFSLAGEALDAGSSEGGKGLLRPHRAASFPHAKSVWDGWISDYTYAGNVPDGLNLTTDWLVPLPPKKTGVQDIAFFNDFQTKDLILQPVLDFNGEMPGEWAIESENCCASGNDIQSDLIKVNPGDLIRGVVTTASCDAKGVCANWTVTTTDMTTGKSTTLTMQNPKQPANTIDVAVLETYDVTSCDMFPENGEITFFNNVVTTPEHAVQQFTYDFFSILMSPPIPKGFPIDCGYRGASADGRYTLFFGSAPMPIGDGGVPPAEDAGARNGSGDGGSASAVDGDSSAGGAGGGGAGDDASANGGAGGGGTGGTSGGGHDAGTNGGSHPTDANPSSGCSCAITDEAESAPPIALGLGVLSVFGLALVRRRRRPRA